MVSEFGLVDSYPGNPQFPRQRGARARKWGVTRRGAALADKNASFSRESRFKIKHFRIEFTDRQLVALAALRTLRGFMFLAFGDPFVDVRPTLHTFPHFLKCMFWREAITFYVVQIQLIRD